MFRPQFWFLSVFLLCCDASRHPRYMPVVVFGRPFGGFLHHPSVHKSAINARTYDYVKTDSINQPLDHFDPKNTEMWKQHFMYNRKFDNGSGLAFCFVGGDSKISRALIGNENYTWLVWAKKFGAATFQVEHRFYGDSQPKRNMSIDSYQYFTIEQALADLNSFIQQMNQKFFKGVKTRWVLFGGSYSGALSAWFRSKNPDITVGSVSSSALLHTQLDYYQYAQNVELVLRRNSESCADNIHKGIEEIYKLLYTSDGRNELEELFNLCDPFPATVQPKDIQFFLSNIFGTFQSIAQYSGADRDEPRRNGLGIPNICQIMNNENEPNTMKRIKAVMDFYRSFYEAAENCTENSYEAFIEYMKNVTYDPPDYERSSARGWMWQCCTQLGFMQTTDNGKSIFGSSIPLDFYVDMCMDVFGDKYDADFIRKSITQIHKMLGGARNFHASNVILPSGENDPWKSAGYHGNDTASGVFSFLIKDCAHCCDMYPASENDSLSVKDARNFMEQKLKTFIGV